MKLFLFNNDEKLIGTVSPLEGIQNEEINKIQTIECTVVYSELIEKASYIGHKDYSDNRIFHLYKIDHITKTSTTDVKIVGVHTFFDDMESDGYVKDFRPTNRELVGVLTTILDGSRWQLGTVNIQRRFTGNFYYVTRKEAISKLIEATQIEIKPRLEFSRGKITGRYLDVFTRLGARNGKVFVHGRDLLTVSEKKSQGAIYTAVVGRGKGEETDTGGYGRRISFKDVEWRRTSGQPVDKPVGQEYVEIPAMTKLYGFDKGTKPRIKIVEFQDETDKEKLLRLSYEWLEKNSRMQVEYSAKVLNVGNLELGDTVGIFNPKLGIKYETRVFKVKRNLVNNKLTEFGIGDKVNTSPFSRTIELAKEMKNFQDDTVYWLDKIRERLSDKLINEDGYNYDLKADNEYKVPAGYYSFDKPIDQNPTKVVYMGAGKIAIANSKKPTGEWNWKTFLDGRGATLDLINTGVLKAGRIQSADGRSYWDLDTGEFHMEQSAINEAVKTAVSGKVQEIVGEVKKNLPTKEELKGKSSYIHKKYSDYADGRNMSDNSTLKYIGIYTGDKEQAPTNASEYSWSKIWGEDGRDGVDGKPVNENLVRESGEPLQKEGHSWGGDWEVRTHPFYYNSGKKLMCLPNSTTRENFIRTHRIKLKRSTDYVISFKGFASANVSSMDLHVLGRRNNETSDFTIFTRPAPLINGRRLSGNELEVVKNIRFNSGEMDEAFLRFDNNGSNNNQQAILFIAEVKLEEGTTSTDWTPAYEDLQGHSLTANLRFEGRYINSVLADLNTFVDVFYDGQKITEGFELKVKHKGMGINNWTDFISRPYDSTGKLTNFIFSNGEKDGTPLEVIVLVTYKGINTITNERIENVPDVTEIKETVKKYKIFESTLDRFNSTIGQVKEQVVNGNRNYITNSGSLNDKSFGSWNKWEKSIQNGTIVFTKINGSDTTGFFLALTDLVKTQFQNEPLTWSLDIKGSRNATFRNVGFETNGKKQVDITTNWQRISHTFINKFTDYYGFVFYNPTTNFNNGDKIYIRFPKLEKGNVATEWTVAPEDVSLLKETTETSIEQTNRNLELKVSKDNVIASINASVETTGEGPAQGVVKINADKVDISGVLSAYTGEIGGFRIGHNPNDGGGLWLTGQTNFDCGINPGVNEGSNGAQFWAAWGREWSKPGPNAWWVTAQGLMVCKNTPTFHKGMEVYGRYIDTHSNDIQGDKSGGGKTTVVWWSQINKANSSSSDKRLKTNIKPTKVNALDMLNNIEMVEFNWKKDNKFEKLGAIAQQVQSVEESLVVHDMDDKQTYNDYLRISYYNTIPYLIKGIQELSEENTNLKSQLNEMNERLQKLEDKINGNL